VVHLAQAMAVPTISSISPAFGHTGGREFVRMDGGNFRLPPAPPGSGPVPNANDTVAVELNGKRALRVVVASSSRLYFVTPIQDPGKVTVVVRNLDDDGVPISLESAALIDGFEYRLPPLTGKENEGILARVTRALLQELKRQVLPNTNLTVSVEYDPSTGDDRNYIDPASLPALTLFGPALIRNKVNFRNVGDIETSDPGEFLQRRAPRTHDANFTLVGLADKTIELLNLMEALQLFVDRNPYLEMLRDADDPSKGTVRYEMDFAPGGDLRVGGQADDSDIRNFRGEIYVRGIELASVAGFGDDAVVDRGAALADGVTLDPTEQLGS